MARRSVRNIRRTGESLNPKPIPSIDWIPPIFNVIHKITVDDGTQEYDITDFVIDASFTYGGAGTIGDFNIALDNSSEIYTNLFVAWNKVYLYLDYAAEATSKVFTGMIERPSKNNNRMTLTGQSSATRFTKKAITYSATDKSRSDILKEIVSENFTDLLTTGVEDNTELATVNYTEIPFQDILNDLAGSDYDVYIDKNFNVQYFVLESRQNETEAIVHGNNLVSTGDFSPDLEQVRNKIKVYGSDVDGIPYLYSTKNDNSISQYDQRDLKIEAKSVTTLDQLKQIADYEEAKNGEPPIVGTVKSLALPTILPGDMLRVSDPQNGIDPDYYRVQKYTHIFSNDEPPMTEITIAKERASISNIVSGRVKFEINAINNQNPLGLDYSYIVDFNTDITLTEDNTEIVLETTSDTSRYVLKTISGNAGTWETEDVQLSGIVSKIQFITNGEKLEGTWPEGTTIEYSFDGGQSWNKWGVTDTVGDNTGLMRLRVTFSSSETRVKSIGLLYNI